jgi:hypothetical protein
VRRDAALGFLASVAPELSDAVRPALADEAIRIIEHPELADLFGPRSRAEIDLLAQLHLTFRRDRRFRGSAVRCTATFVVRDA